MFAGAGQARAFFDPPITDGAVRCPGEFVKKG